MRILKQNVWFESKTFKWGKIWYGLSISMIFIIFIFPVYPSISNIVYTNSEIEFYRWDIDENSILSSYEWNWVWDENLLLEHVDSYVSVNTILLDDRDLDWINEIIKYEVKAWDSIASIASKVWVSVNTVLWANNMDYARSLVVWEIIRVPTTTWYLYKVKYWDRIENIAKEYWITVSAIEKQNWIKNGYLIAGQEILLPWAAKKVPVVEKPKATNTSTSTKNTAKTNTTTNKTATTNTTKTSWWTSEYTSNAWTYKLVRRAPKWRFVYWNCTWYVAQYANVDWGWNANQWIKNARAKGHPTWNTPKLWAIVQFSWRGYNPYYGHVWIVVWITSTHIIVSDMNYKAVWVVTERKVPIWDASIDGYIYPKQ